MRASRPQLWLLPDPGLVDQFVQEFLDAKRAAGRADSTLKFYTTVLREFSRFVAHWPPGPEDVEAYLLHKREQVRETTLASCWRGVSCFLRWCEGRGHLADNPLSSMDRPRTPRSLPKAARRSDIAALFSVVGEAAAQGDQLALRDAALFRVAYDTGLRANELARLRRDDLDEDEQALFVRAGKGGRDRVVYFGDRCRAALAAWLRRHPGGDPLFVSRVRTELRPLTRRGVYWALQRWCKRAGVRLTVHQLRHSYATHALRRGIDLGHVSRQLGHSSIATTAIYLAADDTARRQAHRERAPGDDI